jgi:YVTN family beta-propeller protein
VTSLASGVVIAFLVLAACAGTSSDRETLPPAPTVEGEDERRLPDRDGTQANDRASVWVANEEGRTLTRVDVVTGAVLETHSTAGRPHNLAVSRSGTAAATLPSEGALFLLDATANVQVVALGGQPHDVKSVGSRFIVANEGTRRLQILEGDRRQVGEVPLPAPPHDHAVSEDGRTAWVSLDGTDQLAVVDLETPALDRVVPTGGSPHDLLVSDAGELWVTNWDGPLRVYSAEGQPRGRVDLGSESHHLAFSPDGSQVWVTDNSARRVFVVDTATRWVIDSMETPGAPHHVAIVAGRGVVADSTGAVVIFDAQTRRQSALVPTGAGPHGVAARA